MIVIPHILKNGQTVYDIDFGNGKMKRVSATLPEEFHIYQSRAFTSISVAASEHFFRIRTALNVKFDCLEDYRNVIDSQALQSIRTSVERWGIFALYTLKRIDKLFAVMQDNDEGPIDSNLFDSISKLVAFCSDKLTRYWISGVGLDFPMYDVQGIQSKISTLETIEDRVRFLDNLLLELRIPVSCELSRARNSLYDAQGLPRYPGIYVKWRHAITESDYKRLYVMAKELHRRLDSEYRDLLLQPPFHEEQGRSSSEKIKAERLKWRSTQADLVYIMDRLIEAGLLEATSAEITGHFDYGSISKDPPKTYRDMRKKLKDGLTYPSKERILRLIEALNRDLR